jgi:fumarylacetoacetate (FAA) hydrolase
MKLATLKNGTRDGRLVIVSRDLARAVDAAPVVTNLQQAIERWDEVHPALESLSAALNAGTASMDFAFDPAAAMAPLPRTHQFVDASAFLNHGHIMSGRTTWT